MKFLLTGDFALLILNIVHLLLQEGGEVARKYVAQGGALSQLVNKCSHLLVVEEKGRRKKDNNLLSRNRKSGIATGNVQSPVPVDLNFLHLYSVIVRIVEGFFTLQQDNRVEKIQSGGSGGHDGGQDLDDQNQQIGQSTSQQVAPKSSFFPLVHPLSICMVGLLERANLHLAGRTAHRLGSAAASRLRHHERRVGVASVSHHVVGHRGESFGGHGQGEYNGSHQGSSHRLSFGEQAELGPGGQGDAGPGASEVASQVPRMDASSYRKSLQQRRSQTGLQTGKGKGGSSQNSQHSQEHLEELSEKTEIFLLHAIFLLQKILSVSETENNTGRSLIKGFNYSEQGLISTFRRSPEGEIAGGTRRREDEWAEKIVTNPLEAEVFGANGELGIIDINSCFI